MVCAVNHIPFTVYRDLTIRQPLTQIVGVEVTTNEDNMITGDGAVPRFDIEGAAFATELKDVLVGAFFKPWSLD